MQLGRLVTTVPLLVACVATAPRAAQAQEIAPERSGYDRLVDEGLAEFDAGHFEEALSAFEQAYRIRPSARVLRAIAKALFERRLYARCIAAIDRAFASDVDPLTEALRADLESLRARALHFVGQAVIEVAPDTATLVLDGEPLESGSKSPRLVDVGTHTLEASAPAHEPQRRRFEVHGGEVTRLAMRLEPIRAGVAAPAPAPVSRPAPDARSFQLPLAVASVVVSTGAVVGSSIWFVDREGAIERCNDAAAAGASCANGGSIAFQRNVAMWTVGLSAGALIASTVALVLVLRSETRPASARARPVWSW